MKSILSFGLVALIYLHSAAYANNGKMRCHHCTPHGKYPAIESVHSEELVPGIRHVEFAVKVGKGKYDKITLHRIVRENRFGRAARTRDAVMMVHGDAYGFDSFIASVNSQVVPQDQSIAIQMAKAGIDVWGIDLRWTAVPASETDLSFMADWDMKTDLADLDTALRIARKIRHLRGNRNSKLNLLGWSRGGQLGYLYLARESQLVAARRNIKGFIPVDIAIKTDNDDIRQAACLRQAAYQAQIDAGQYADNSGLILQSVSLLAQAQPDEPSPIVDGFTNQQTMLLFLSATFSLTPGVAETPWYHYNAAIFDNYGLPAMLAFSNPDYLHEYALGVAAYEPANIYMQGAGLLCDSTDYAFDDHLQDIRVPILYVYAAGGFGKAGIYSAQMTASRDVSIAGVQTLPDEYAAADFGHVDLFTADNAGELVWSKIINWIQAH